MKTLKKYVVIALLTFFLGGSMYSCLIFETNPRHDNGNHNGWYKNPNNPHNPAHHKQKGNGKN
jgi:hypothetical protein